MSDNTGASEEYEERHFPRNGRRPVRLLVCGSRNWTDKGAIRLALAQGTMPGDVVIHGGAPGADTIAGEAAVTLGCAVEVYPAEWAKYGPAAGPIRNQRMIDEGRPDVVLAFPLPDSRGTADMMWRAIAAGIPVLDGSKP